MTTKPKQESDSRDAVPLALKVLVPLGLLLLLNLVFRNNFDLVALLSLGWGLAGGIFAIVLFVAGIKLLRRNEQSSLGCLWIFFLVWLGGAIFTFGVTFTAYWVMMSPLNGSHAYKSCVETMPDPRSASHPSPFLDLIFYEVRVSSACTNDVKFENHFG